MKWRATGKSLLFFAGSLLCCYLALLSTVQIKSRILRHRAEALRADLRELEAGKSTWADLQMLQSRWGRWANYKGQCDFRSCDYEIRLGSFPKRSRAQMLFASIVHDHSPELLLHITLRNGIVTDTYLRFIVQVPYGYEPSWDRTYFETGQDPSIKEGYELIATAESTSDFLPNCCSMSRREHPSYEVGQYTTCGGCLSVRTAYSPLAAPATRARLTDFNLDCATRWHPCSEELDIFPGPWREHMAERRNPRYLDDYVEAPAK